MGAQTEDGTNVRPEVNIKPGKGLPECEAVEPPADLAVGKSYNSCIVVNGVDLTPTKAVFDPSSQLPQFNYRHQPIT